ncbi:MAG: transporter substrate-binding domain-containing protein [Alphaproteobacteria bacterium]|nr:transporter substrate-binding domain-containing protein [Alphaproteobacteria bacterium]
MSKKLSILAVAVSLFALGLVFFQPKETSTKKESGYARVLRTGTLRCGYLLAPPLVAADPNTGALSGMNIDYVTKMAETLGLSVTWDEVLPGQQVEALRTGKADAICAGEGPLVANTSAYLHYSAPIAFFPFHIYVRANDTRFDGTLEAALKKADDPALTAAMMDGDLTQEFAARFFPRARRHDVPQNAGFAQLYMDVADGKADFVITEPFTTGEFMKNNPGKLRRAAIAKPFTVIPNQMSVLYGDEALIAMLSQGIAVMRQRGLEDAILGKYEREYPGSFYRAPEPYKSN